MYRLLVLGSIWLLLVGCTSIGGLVPSPGAASQNICVLTTAEIEQYWGWPDTIPESEQGEKGPTCGYRDSGSIAETVFRLYLVPFTADCEQLRSSENSTAIDGIGEWAYWSEDRQKLYAKLGSNCLQVTTTYPGSEDIDYMTGLTELSKLAAARL